MTVRRKSVQTKKPVQKVPAKPGAPVKKKKVKRRLNPVAVALFAAIIIAIWAAFAIPKGVTNNKLKKLGYSKETIVEIRKQKLTKTLLKTGYYSEYLEQCIMKENVNLDYLELYTKRDTEHPLGNEDFLLYNRLADYGYEEDQLLNLFTQLDYDEMTPLLVLDWQYDENPYIEDVVSLRGKTRDDDYPFAGNYRRLYKFTSEVDNLHETDMLINYTHYLPEDYEPEELVDLSSEIAVYGMSLEKEAAKAADDLIRASVNAGVPFFVATSYLSWSDQNYAWEMQAKRTNEDVADELVTRAGHSEHQSGLAINVVPTYEGDDFENTEVYDWLKVHASEYGWIQRYPSAKSKITGMTEEENHYRYVGEKLAKAVEASGKTFDEYCMLYLVPWSSAEHMPSQEILTATKCTANIVGQKPAKEETPADETPEEGSVQEEEKK